MSWLSNITGKAEEFLNKIDQSAAQALHKEEEEQRLNLSLPLTSDVTSLGSPPPSSRDHKTDRAAYSVPSKTTLKKDNSGSSFVSTPIKANKASSLGGSSGVTKQTGKVTPKPQVDSVTKQVPSTGVQVADAQEQKVSPASGPAKKKLDTDEALFDFLNSSEPLEASKKKPAPPPVVEPPRHSRQSSTSSVVSNKGGKSNADTPVSTSGSSIVHVDGVPPESDRGSPSEPDGSADVLALADAMMEQSPSNSVSSNQDGDHTAELHQKISSLELENKLLKNEVASLNQEMATVLQRSKDSQSDLQRLRMKLDDYNRTASMSDQMVRELQSRESDLMEALQAKDSQLAVLRVRLEEADKEMESKQRSITDLESQRERILKDHTDSSGVHSQALDSLKQKLVEVEGALRREQEALKKIQQESSDRQSRLEQEQRGLAESLTAAERRINEERAKASDLSNQLKTAKAQSENAKQELTDYKEKATRILQSKERLIASLREGSGASGEAVGVSSLEYDSVKQERDMFKEELQQTKMTMENLRMELSAPNTFQDTLRKIEQVRLLSSMERIKEALQDLEAQLQQDSDTANDQISSLEESLRLERRKCEDAEQELLKQKQELQYSIEETRKQKTTFQTCVSDREAEIERLRNQIMTKSMSSSTESELESRVKTLTESLIQKQTMLETLGTEKNSLALQLERIQQQYQDIQSSSLRTNTVVHVHDDDEVRQRLPAFMRETPSDHEVVKKMKGAANTIDKFSIRLGIFFRRNPMARVFVILYMVLLHLWVMVVLLTYQPEMHGADFKQPQDPAVGAVP